jgi:hypothetical protein
MSLLTQASLVLTPNAVKASKLYSIIPSNGNGDMTVVRATTATRVNSSGLIESVASNVPRLNYDGSCPSILIEPQRTNLLLNSVWTGGGSTPTSWSKQLTGNTVPVTSIKNPNVTAYNFNGVSTRGFFSQVTAFTINNTYAISIYVESVSVANSIGSILITANATGITTYLKNNVLISAASNIEAGNTYTLIFAATATTTGSETRIGLGTGGAITGDFTLSMPQVETGSASVAAYSTSFIPTTTQTITRNADIISRNNIYTNNLITSAGGTFFIELNNNIAFARDASKYSIGIDTAVGGLTNGFSIKSFGAGSQRLTIVKIIASVQTNLYVTLTNSLKIAIDWNGTTADVFVNGVKVTTATPFAITNMQFLFATAEDVPKYVKSMMLFHRPLTDVECIALTTL